MHNALCILATIAHACPETTNCYPCNAKRDNNGEEHQLGQLLIEIMAKLLCWITTRACVVHFS